MLNFEIFYVLFKNASMTLAQAFVSLSATFTYEKVLLEEHCAEIEFKIT